MKKELRPYQIDAKKAVFAALERGVTKQILVLATGLGKTFTAISILKEFKRVLFVTHVEELIEQSALAIIKDYYSDDFSKKVQEQGFIDFAASNGFKNEDLKVGLVKADKFIIDAGLVIASAQTLHRRLDRIPEDYFDLVICDEAHLFMSNTFLKSLEYFKPKLTLGLTATPHRADGMPLANFFQEIVFDYGIKEGITNKYLCELKGIQVKTTTSLDNVKTTGGDFNAKDLADEIDTPQRNNLVVASYIKHAKGRQAIFYCVDIAHAMHLAEVFNDYGIKCKAVSANDELTPNRSGNIKDFKQGELEVLTNVNILVAGFDHPNVGCIGMASPTKSLTKYLQSLGRGTRLKDDKFIAEFGQNCIILDFLDNTSRHNIVNTWTLDRDKDPEDRIFVTSEDREKLLEARRKRFINVHRERDEEIILLKIPKPFMPASEKWKDPATEKQLDWIKNLGYDIVNEVYTKEMASMIISNLPAPQRDVDMIKNMNYDISSVTVVTRAMVDACLKDHQKRQNKSKPYYGKGSISRK